MFRLILAVILLTLGFPCFSEESRYSLKEWQKESVVYFSYGSTNLLLNKPEYALEDFQTASSFVDRSDNSSSFFDFLISFGQVIAYDRLECRDQCKQAIGSLVLAINEWDDDEDFNDEDFNSNESQMLIGYLRNLAILAPSSDIKKFLLSLLDDMVEELLTSSKFAHHPLLGNIE